MEFNDLQTLALSGVALIIGYLIHRWVPFTAKYNLPGPVLGGFILAVMVLVLKNFAGLQIQFSKGMQLPLMIAFFASLGFGASIRALTSGGKKVMVFFLICVGTLFLQNFVGVAVAKMLGLHPLFGVLAGSVSLTGGPGTALAFADLFEKAGVTGAATIGVTAAMAGIVLAGVIGGPISTLLIELRGLRGKKSDAAKQEAIAHPEVKHTYSDLSFELLKHAVILIIVMAIGAYASRGIEGIGITVPAYVGSMLIAAIVRNLDDKTQWFKIHEPWLEALGMATLALFIGMSMMTLDLAQLWNLAGPLSLILVVQTVLTVLVAVFVVFKLKGSDYEAAVIAGGFVGFMLGTTANAMANLDSVTKRYGPAPFAYLLIPLVGACFIDFVNAGVIALLLNVFGNAPV